MLRFSKMTSSRRWATSEQCSRLNADTSEAYTQRKEKKKTMKRKQTRPHESSEVNRMEVRVYRYFNAV